MTEPVQSTLFDSLRSDAVFSDCGRFRYMLWRAWGEQTAKGLPDAPVNFLMLNPSTADYTRDDPTIRRCIGFSKDWGFNGVIITNVYPFRSTDPKAMMEARDRTGETSLRSCGGEFARVNDAALMVGALASKLCVCAWGINAERQEAMRAINVLKSSRVQAFCLGKTKDGSPKHPLYLPRDAKPIPYR